ncbi:MAG: hypothetical protein IIZ19_02340 [Clostridia bacterium]|nr:hypothetical protein [Clostridia bacterium]
MWFEKFLLFSMGELSFSDTLFLKTSEVFPQGGTDEVSCAFASCADFSPNAGSLPNVILSEAKNLFSFQLLSNTRITLSGNRSHGRDSANWWKNSLE